MANDITTGKRLAKNTLFMYFRMFFLTLISLFTSRVILQQLGVEDFGIYNLVGSIVLLFQSLKSIFATSTQRFSSYEMGLGHQNKLQVIYVISTVINAFIALGFIILVECVGCWFFANKINVPIERISAARWVFQFSVLSMVIGFISNPLNAFIISHERMDFYAYLSLIEGVLKLGICYLLSVAPFDKLIFYGLLVLFVTVLVYFANLIFCKTQFEECRLARCWDRQLFRQMFSFAGWGFLGNTSFALTQSGLNLVLNVFGGPIVNAARGIAQQVTTTIQGFVSNIAIVIRPYTTKTYARGEFGKTLGIVYLSSKVYFLIQLVFYVIFTFFAEDILRLWLGQVPEYSVVFVDLVLLHAVIKSLHSPLDMLFSAEGKIKVYQIVESIVLFLPLPASYLLLSKGLPYYSAFLALIICEIVHISIVSMMATKICRLDGLDYLRKVIFPCALCALPFILVVLTMDYMEKSLLYKFVLLLLIITFIVVIMFLCGVSDAEKKWLAQLRKSSKEG